MIDYLPKISVVMPLYNADRFLEESIESILKQTYTNFEFIIVCSDPTEITKKILNNYQRIDARICVIYQEKKGIIFARNIGCQQAKGEYIAVMDADDISSPYRFDTQLTFTEKHPDIGIVGSWADIINENGILMECYQPPINSFVIGWHLIFYNCMLHLTIMIRSEVLKKLNYYSLADNGFPEDYDLWTRAFFITKIANIPKSLAKHRLHNSNNSLEVSFEMELFCTLIQYNMIQKLIGETHQPSFDEIQIRKKISIFNFDQNNINIQIDLIETLYRHYLNSYSLSASEIKEIKSHISFSFLRYSKSMFQFSKKKSLCLLFKSLYYSPLTALKQIMRSIGKTAVSTFKQKLSCVFVKKE